MAVVNTKATALTNSDATPPVLNNPTIQHQFVREAVGTLEAVSGDSIGSTYRLARVRSNARISAVILANDAITTSAANIGIYRTADDGGAVVAADLFGSAVSLATASTGTDVTHASGVFGVEDVEKPLWQALGLSSDPGVDYDIVATLTAAAGSAGTVSVKVRYVM